MLELIKFAPLNCPEPRVVSGDSERVNTEILFDKLKFTLNFVNSKIIKECFGIHDGDISLLEIFEICKGYSSFDSGFYVAVLNELKDMLEIPTSLEWIVNQIPEVDQGRYMSIIETGLPLKIDRKERALRSLAFRAGKVLGLSLLLYGLGQDAKLKELFEGKQASRWTSNFEL